MIIGFAVLGLALGVWFYYSDISRSDTPLYTATLEAFFYDPAVKNPKAVVEGFVLGAPFQSALRSSTSVEPDTLRVNYNEARLVLSIEIRTYDYEHALVAPTQALEVLNTSYAGLEIRKIALVLLNNPADGAKGLLSTTSLDSPPFELHALGTTRISLPKAVWPQKALLSIFACLFAGFLLAFMAEGLAKLHADPVARKKLRDAWGRRA
jgi:hypothetical protein